MQALFGGHSLFKHIQANWTHELAVQTSGTDSDFRAVSDCILRRTVQLVKW